MNTNCGFDFLPVWQFFSLRKLNICVRYLHFRYLDLCGPLYLDMPCSPSRLIFYASFRVIFNTNIWLKFYFKGQEKKNTIPFLNGVLQSTILQIPNTK